MENTMIKILLVEDDENECKIYNEIASKRKNIKFVATTNSSTKALEYLKHYKPDSVILDLELTNGEGSGFDFIESLTKQTISKMPNIVVTTNVCSNTVYDFCHKNGIDFIFYKKQVNYSQEKVIDTLLLLSGYTNNSNKVFDIAPETDEIDLDTKIMEKINSELDLIGVSSHLQGRKYLCDAIYYVIKNSNDYSKISATQALVGKYKKSNSTISRAMQNAILHAWRVSAIEDLNTYYTAKINYETGVPTPVELIYYYAEKIKKEL